MPSAWGGKKKSEVSRKLPISISLLSPWWLRLPHRREQAVLGVTLTGARFRNGDG